MRDFLINCFVQRIASFNKHSICWFIFMHAVGGGLSSLSEFCYAIFIVDLPILRLVGAGP